MVRSRNDATGKYLTTFVKACYNVFLGRLPKIANILIFVYDGISDKQDTKPADTFDQR